MPRPRRGCLPPGRSPPISPSSTPKTRSRASSRRSGRRVLFSPAGGPARGAPHGEAVWVEGGALVSDIGGARHEVLAAGPARPARGRTTSRTRWRPSRRRRVLGTPVVRDPGRPDLAFSGLPHRTELVAESRGFAGSTTPKARTSTPPPNPSRDSSDGSVNPDPRRPRQARRLRGPRPARLAGERVTVLTIGEAAETIEAALRGSRDGVVERCGAIARGRRARRGAGASGRHGPALAGVRLVRPVQELRRARPPLRGARARSGEALGVAFPDHGGDSRWRVSSRPTRPLRGPRGALALRLRHDLQRLGGVGGEKPRAIPYRFLIKQIAALACGGAWRPSSSTRTDYRKFARPWVVYGAYAVTLLAGRPTPCSGRRSTGRGGGSPRGLRCCSPRSFSRSPWWLVLAYPALAQGPDGGQGEEMALLPCAVLLGRGRGRRGAGSRTSAPRPAT